jgi:microcystin-dependent protein
VADQFLPLATTEPPSAPGSNAAPLQNAVDALAGAVLDSTVSPGEATNLRFAVITQVEASGDRRVKTDITGTAWLSRDIDTTLSVGDRVWIIQQGPVSVVCGRLTGLDVLIPVGAVEIFAGVGASVPTGWLLCDGAAVSRTTYAGLFAVIGTTFGAGNGTTSFNVPNLVNRMAVGSGGSYARGATGGASSVTLTTAQMPSHNHGSVGSHNHSGSGSTSSTGSHSHSETGAIDRAIFPTGGGTNAAYSSGDTTGSAGNHSHTFSVTTDSDGAHTHSSEGSGLSHENMPPFIALNFIIRAL